MPIKNCFENFGRSDLQKKFESSVNSGKSEAEAAREILLDEHKNLHDQTNGLRNEINKGIKNKKEQLPLSEYKQPEQPQKPKVRVTAEQLEAAQPKEKTTNTEVQQEEGGGIKPPKETVPFAEEDKGGNKTGLSHEALSDTAKRLGLKEPERGSYQPHEWYIERGRQLINSGVDPDEVGKQFLKDENINTNVLSVAAAHEEALSNDADAIKDKSSKAFQDAKTKLENWQDIAKQMGTKAGEHLFQLQNPEGYNPKSPTSIVSKLEKNSGTKATTTEVKQAEDLSNRVKELEQKNKDLSDRLDKLINKGKSNKPVRLSEYLSDAAKQMRTSDAFDQFLKGDKGNIQKMGVDFPRLKEIGASILEDAAKVAKTLEDAIDYIKDAVSKIKEDIGDKDKLANGLISILKSNKQQNEKEQLEDLQKRFVDKKDNKFSTEDQKALWDYAKSKYIDGNPNFNIGKTVRDLSDETGLSGKQIISALSITPETRAVTTQMYRNQYESRKTKQAIDRWVNKKETKPIVKLLNAISTPFRAAATFAHSTALLGTHAAMLAFDPKYSKDWFSLAGKQFPIVFGNKANYEKAVSWLQNHPLYNIALKAKLAVDPNSIYDDWQLANTWLKKIGVQGNKGFLILKMMRMKVFEGMYNELSNAAKSDKNVLENVAENANLWTGTSRIPVSPVGNALVFAPNLIASKFQRILGKPAEAIATYSKAIIPQIKDGKVTFDRWDKVPLADKIDAKLTVQRSAKVFAGYVGALVANQALLSLTGSNQSINFFNFHKSDWLKFKAGDMNVDPSGGMQGSLQFLAQVAALPAQSKADLKENYFGATNAVDALKGETFGYLRRIASPVTGTTVDVLTHRDFQGNVLPFYNDPVHGNQRKLSLFDYAMEKGPIPIAEAGKAYKDELVAHGMNENKAKVLVASIMIGAIGSMGIKISEDKQYSKPTPFIAEDKKDPVFKYFLDKGLELPNTALSSEPVNDKATKTIKHVSDYSPAIQKDYTDTHKQFLKQELSRIIEQKYVYVTPYDKVSIDIGTDNPPEEAKPKKLDDLTTDELKQVLHKAQSNATKQTKLKIFKQPIEETKDEDEENQ